MYYGIFIGALTWLAIRRACFGRWWLWCAALATLAPGARCRAQLTTVAPGSASIEIHLVTGTVGSGTTQIAATASKALSAGTITGSTVTWPPGSWFLTNTAATQPSLAADYGLATAGATSTTTTYTDATGTTYSEGAFNLIQEPNTVTLNIGTNAISGTTTPSGSGTLTFFISDPASPIVTWTSDTTFGPLPNTSETDPEVPGTTSTYGTDASTYHNATNTSDILGDGWQTYNGTRTGSGPYGSQGAYLTWTQSPVGPANATGGTPTTTPTTSPTTTPDLYGGTYNNVLFSPATQPIFVQIYGGPTTYPAGYGSISTDQGAMAAVMQAVGQPVDQSLAAIAATQPAIADQISLAVLQQALPWPQATDPDPITNYAPVISGFDFFFADNPSSNTITVTRTNGQTNTLPSFSGIWNTPITLFFSGTIHYTGSVVQYIEANCWAAATNYLTELGHVRTAIQYIIDFAVAFQCVRWQFYMWCTFANVRGNVIPGLDSAGPEPEDAATEPAEDEDLEHPADTEMYTAHYSDLVEEADHDHLEQTSAGPKQETGPGPH